MGLSARRSGSSSPVIIAAVFGAMLLAPWSPVALGQAVKLQKPADSAIAKEIADVQATYERELIKAKNDEAAALALVQELIGKVPGTPDAVGKWSLLLVAQEVAERDSGNIDVALKCAAKRASLFEIDAIKDRLAVLQSFSEPKPPASTSLYGKAMQAARDALATEKYAEAKEAAEIAAAVAAALNKNEKDEARRITRESKGKIKPPKAVAEEQYVTPALRFVKRINEARNIAEAHAPAKELLKTRPNESTAKVAVGEYECFVKGSWDTGLPLVAAGLTTPMAEVAGAEIKACDPLDTAKLFDVADRWWALAKDHFIDSELKSDAIRAHAADVYSAVLPTLTKPIEVKRATDRIAEAGHSPLPSPATAVVFLSDLQEDESKVVHFGFGKGTINGKNNPIRSIIDGKESPHGLSMHPGDGPNDQCFVKYTLPKGTRRLSAIATLDKGGSFDHCGIGFEVVADDRVVWRSKTINKDHRFELCEIDVNDCRNLELRTYKVTAAFGGHAVWIEPRLTVDTRVWPKEQVRISADRAAAQWALGIKGKVEVEHPDKKREWIDSQDKIPTGPFVVTSLDLVANQQVNDDETARFSKLTMLESLGLGGTAITDVTMEHISRLPRLKGLGVNWTKVTGQGLQRLTSAKLESIDCSGVQDIHQGIQRLHAMGSVRVLVFGLTDMQKNPETLKLVSEMKTLRHLQFGKDDMSPAQIQSLQQALPQCVMVK
jgi:hypothetical protein